jgi:hypothetical protein
MEKSNKETFYKTIVIPHALERDVLNLKLSNIRTNQAFHVIDVLMKYAERRDYNNNPYDYTVCSQALLIRLIGQRYFEVVTPLRSSGIIENNDYFNPLKGEAYYYRVNPSYFKDRDLNFVKRKVKYKQVLDADMNDAYFQYHFESFMRRLTIPIEKLYKALDKHLANLNISQFRVDSEIKDSIIELYKDGKDRYYTEINKAIEVAHKEGMHIIQDKRSFYQDTTDAFIARKKRNVERFYKQAIANLENGYFRAGRNRTNQRLDHNLTSFPSILLKIIMKENNLVEIDAVNSQFTILANKMRYKEVSGTGFIEHALDGKLYDRIKKGLNLESRQDAKMLAFKIIFGSHKTNSKEKDKLKTIYPEFIDYVNNQKELHGSKKFSVKLQTIESRLYVDQFLLRNLEMGYPLITKHDSIICYPEDLVEIGTVVLEVMKRLNFQCVLKVSYPDGKDHYVSRLNLK